MKVLEWDQYFMSLAKLASVRSGCNSRPTGAVIVSDKRVIATGYNGNLSGHRQCKEISDLFCRRRSKTLNDKGEEKYQECVSIHAEQNAMNQIAKYGGVKLEGAKIYCTLSPCIFCLKNIASVGIKEIYYEMLYESDDPVRDEVWKTKVLEFGIKTKHVYLTIEEELEVIKHLKHKTSSRRI